MLGIHVVFSCEFLRKKNISYKNVHIQYRVGKPVTTTDGKY